MIIGDVAKSKKSGRAIVFVKLDMDGIEKFTNQLVKNLEAKSNSVLCVTESGKLFMMDDSMVPKKA